ncbi:MAG: hypothetical protein PHV06_02050 [bacterium]|nr:hypothetical protein [bacterium]
MGRIKLLLGILFLTTISVLSFGAAFNGSTGLVNIPTADVLEHIGYDIGVCSSSAFAGEDEYLDPRMRSEQDARFNLGIHIPTGSALAMNFELGVTQYTLLSEEGRKDGVVNFKLQLFRDPTDRSLHHGNQGMGAMWMPSIALGMKNIVGEGLKYITPAGPYAEYAQNNSAYLVMTKRLNLSPSFGLKLHYGWGGNSFQGHGKDASPGVFYGFSTQFLLGATKNPLDIMLDYDGNAMAFGICFILNNPQMYGNMANSPIRRFLPGLKAQIGISDIEEAMRDYDTAKYDGKKFSPKIEFSLGVTNDYTIKSMMSGDQPSPTPKPKPPKPSNREKEEAEQAKALAEALKAKQLAELARTKAKLESMRVQGVNVDELKADIKTIFPLNKFTGNGFEITMIGVVFTPNTSELAAVSNKKLDALAPVLQKYRTKNVKATIIVTSSNAGLSIKRAAVIEQYLITRCGFTPTDITKRPKTGADRIELIIYK